MYTSGTLATPRSGLCSPGLQLFSCVGTLLHSLQLCLRGRGASRGRRWAGKRRESLQTLLARVSPRAWGRGRQSPQSSSTLEPRICEWALQPPCPARLISVQLTPKGSYACESLCKGAAPHSPAPASTLSRRKCQLRPAEGDLVHRMHNCCASRPRFLGLGSRRGGWRTRGVSQAWVPGDHQEVATLSPPPLHHPRWDAEERESFPIQAPEDSGAWEAGLPPAQQPAFLSLTGGPVGHRPSGRGEAPSPREFPARPPEGEGPLGLGLWTDKLRSRALWPAEGAVLRGG